jgi:hypothetical protein
MLRDSLPPRYSGASSLCVLLENEYMALTKESRKSGPRDTTHKQKGRILEVATRCKERCPILGLQLKPRIVTVLGTLIRFRVLTLG